MAQAHILISSQVLASPTASVTFSSIPSTYRDLRVVIVGQMGSAATAQGTSLRINADSGTNYNRVYMAGLGSSTSSSVAASLNAYFTEEWSNTEWVQYQLDFLDYATIDRHKSFLVRNGAAGNAASAQCGRWASTAAITSLTFYGSDAFAGVADSWIAGSTFYLYGIVG